MNKHYHVKKRPKRFHLNGRTIGFRPHLKEHIPVNVVVQFCPWFKFYSPLFLSMVMYDNEFEKIKLNHHIYTKVFFHFKFAFESGSMFCRTAPGNCFSGPKFDPVSGATL